MQFLLLYVVGCGILPPCSVQCATLTLLDRKKGKRDISVKKRVWGALLQTWLVVGNWTLGANHGYPPSHSIIARLTLCRRHNSIPALMLPRCSSIKKNATDSQTVRRNKNKTVVVGTAFNITVLRARLWNPYSLTDHCAVRDTYKTPCSSQFLI